MTYDINPYYSQQTSLNIDWDCSSNIPQSLNASLQESLDLNPLITLIILFWILKMCIFKEEFPQKIIP
jgi:hypothetical protein